MEKEIKISLGQAKELLKTTPSLTDVIYSNFPELKPKKRWFEEYKGGNYGAFVGEETGKIYSYYIVLKKSYNNKLTFQTNVQAEQHAKRLNLYTEMQVFANFRNGDWVADWNDEEQNKYGIVIYESLLSIEDMNSYCAFIFQISVKSEKIAEEMLEEFGDRIKECFNLN